MEGFEPRDFFDLKRLRFAGLFDAVGCVWEALARLDGYVQEQLRQLGRGMRGRRQGQPFISPEAFVDEDTVIEDGAVIAGPVLLGRGVQVRANAYIRGPAIIEAGALVGPATHVESAMIMPNALMPSGAYVADSLVGCRTHLGPGVKLSNLKLTYDTIRVNADGRLIDTGLKKLGAIIGDECEIGVNATFNPGSIVGRRCLIYPLCSWRGVLPPESVAKVRQTVEVVKREPWGE